MRWPTGGKRRQNAWFSPRRRCVLWGVLVGVLCLIAALGPFCAPYDPILGDLSATNQPPSAAHLLGTDAVGRDILSRIMAGYPTSLLAAFGIVGMGFAIGAVIGTLSGYFGGPLDAVLMRVADAFMAFPQLVLSVAVAGLMGGGLLNAIIALTAVGWTQYARLARNQVLALRQRAFVQAARAAGVPGVVVAFKHVLPHTLPVLVVTACLNVGGAMLNLAGLSFLGLGAMPPAPELGYMINQAAATFALTPWAVFAPAAVILLTVIVLNLFGDAVNDVLVQQVGSDVLAGSKPDSPIRRIGGRFIDAKVSPKEGQFGARDL